jgi:hypothetical protein
MKIEGMKKSVFALKVSGYELQENQGSGFIADWLNAKVSYSDPPIRIVKKMEFLLIEELQHLKEWILMTSDYERCPKRFTFLDNEIGCILHKRGDAKWVKWIMRISEQEREVVEMQVTEQNIASVSEQLDAILSQFPCRCGEPHVTLMELKNRYPYSLVYDEYPYPVKLGLKIRKFKSGYADMEQMTAGNLYAWLHETKRILWDIDPKKKRVTFYTGPITLLGRRLATLVKVDQDRGERIMMELVDLLAHKEMDLLIRRGENIRYCEDQELYMLVLRELNDPELKTFLERFMKMFVEQ